MLDIKFIRQNQEKVKEACQKKGVLIDINQLLKLDKNKREILKEFEAIRAEKNKASKKIKGIKNEKEKKKVIARLKKIDKKEEVLKNNLNKLEKKINEILLLIPNLVLEGVPVGKDEKDNIILRQVGEKPHFDFEPKNYLELSENLEIIDIKRAAKTSGSRFAFLKGKAVLLELGLINFVFEKLTKKGFIPIIPPVMLKEEMARGTGYLEATDREEAYFIPTDNLFLVGTSEQSLIAMHANEVLDEKILPRRYIAFSTCFRREAGSYGKDTKGIFRVHQFDKIEMVSFAKPEESIKEHRFLLEIEESLMNDLKIPYRVVHICTGDLGKPAAEKFDIEAWIPSERRYRETHSTSNCTDFQARRLNIKYLNEKTKKLEFVHTLNGTALAIGRTLIAIIENYQQKDGSILMPEILKKYLPFNEIRK